MGFFSHFWNLTQYRKVEVELKLFSAESPTDHNDVVSLSETCHRTVAQHYDSFKPRVTEDLAAGFSGAQVKL